MKKSIITLFVIVFLFSISGFSLNTDSTSMKRNFHTLEVCIGISPKANSKHVVSTKGLGMYGFWYDYSIKAKNNFYATFILNPLIGGDQFYNEKYNNNGYYTIKNLDNYLLLNVGIGIKYKLDLSKSTAPKHCLIFAIGDLFSYKYLYKHSSTNNTISYNPPINSTNYYNEKYNLSNNPIRFTSFSTAFPMFLKLSYCRKQITFSLTQYLFTQESIYGNGFFERFYTNFNIGITL